MTNGFIYAIEADNGAVKIGWSANPANRFAQIRTHSGAPCKLSRYMAGTMGEERALHRRFSEYRMHGEWFRNEGDVASFISCMNIYEVQRRSIQTEIHRFRSGEITFLELLAYERGLKFRLAGELGITHGAVSQWTRVPAQRVLDVERITGISRHVLRPDIYGPAPEAAQ